MLNDNGQFYYHIFIFVNTTIDYHFQTLQALWANTVVLAESAARVYNCITSLDVARDMEVGGSAIAGIPMYIACLLYTSDAADE